ncbi:hypothetical protein [Naasia sp. SYSU D00948]|uniref:hypothetical protein n=1 Tax=Naasia sp. SYSU D00948 TaxID=2817379 RepID=UPI001B305144|nr:hypothetical protein [Naasia sp. SYSU D00948]
MRPSAIGGALLAVFFRLLQLFRSPRPVHPTGALFTATVRWTGRSRSGIGWIDDPPPGGVQSGIARVSRSVGFPAALPDILGLALRFDSAQGRSDLELASTGIGVPGRFLLRPHRRPERAWLGTLLPYRGARGPVLIGARTRTPADLPTHFEDFARDRRPWILDLYWATARSRWRRFAVLELVALPGAPDSPRLRFDAGRNLLPGAAMPGWVVRLREPGYVATQGDAPLAAPAPGPEDAGDDPRQDRLGDGGAEDLLER